MSRAGRIISINPAYAIPGGEIIINCENFEVNSTDGYGCFFNGQAARLVGASANRILAIVPDDFDSTEVQIYLESGGERSDAKTITVGKKLADDLHIVANPAVDPNDDSIIVTRSGSRGQQLPVTLFRLETDGFLNDMPAEIMNPTGIAFDKNGEMFVTARADGEVCRINRDSESVPYASEMGIATGIAFNRSGEMYIGDRSGTIYRVTDLGTPESFAILEPSVSAYHLAFGTDDNLYLTAPGLSSFDAVYRVDKEGFDEIFYRGLGRPQGIAFDRDGNLYVAACSQGRHGIVKISNNGEKAETFVAGMNVVGLCFTRRGEMIVATGEAVYTLPIGIYGTLLD
ncbi:MAG: gluconolaconase [Acidobacteria bacterium]|jgi:sugar lactone lactonase YvrE|nr:gluconolaconase [Acidobacteriota bacterium]